MTIIEIAEEALHTGTLTVAQEYQLRKYLQQHHYTSADLSTLAHLVEAVATRSLRLESRSKGHTPSNWSIDFVVLVTQEISQARGFVNGLDIFDLLPHPCSQSIIPLRQRTQEKVKSFEAGDPETA